MTTDTIAIVEKQLEAYNQTDLEGFMACYTPDVQLFDLHTHELLASGQEAMRKIYRQRFANPGLHAHIAQRMVLGNFVIDHEQISGFPDKEDQIHEAIAIFHVVDGLIDKAWFIRKD